MGETYYNRYAKPFYTDREVATVIDFLGSESVPTAARAEELLQMGFNRDAVMEALRRLQEEGIDYRDDLRDRDGLYDSGVVKCDNDLEE